MDKDLAYLIGAAGDATVIHNKKRAEYYIEYWQKNCKWLEQSIAPRVKKLFNKNLKTFAKGKGMYLMRFYSKVCYGVFKEYLSNPNLMLQESNEVQLSYVRGFFDAEGSAPKRKQGTTYRVHIYQKNVQPLFVISRILESNNIIVGNLTNSRDIGLLPIRGKNNIITNFAQIVKPEHPDKTISLAELCK